MSTHVLVTKDNQQIYITASQVEEAKRRIDANVMLSFTQHPGLYLSPHNVKGIYPTKSADTAAMQLSAGGFERAGELLSGRKSDPNRRAKIREEILKKLDGGTPFEQNKKEYLAAVQAQRQTA